jgi:hypothetical protein
LTAFDDDQVVLRYLAVVESRRNATDDLPQPDAAAADLAGAVEVVGDDREGLQAQLGEQTPGSDANVRSLEDDFVRAAPGYADRHAVTYDGWLASGVTPDVLERAGIRPSGG